MPVPQLWGAWVDYQGTIGGYYGQTLPGSPLATFESDVGKAVSAAHFGRQWLSNGAQNGFSNVQTGLQNAWDSGRLAMLDWGSWDLSNHANDFSLRFDAINAGTWDSYITSWAQGAAAWKHPFWLRLWHEPNLLGQFPWQIGSVTFGGNTWTNTLAAYLSAWQRIYNLFQQAGATNVTFTWCPNIRSANVNDQSGKLTLAQLYPGSAYVHWLALDGYDDRVPHLTWDQLWHGGGTTGLVDSYAELAALDANLPLCIAETNSYLGTGTAADRATFFSSAFTAPGATTGIAAMARLAMISWFWTNYSAPFYWALDVVPDSNPVTFDLTRADLVAFKNGVFDTAAGTSGSNYVAGGTALPKPADLTPIQAYTTSPPALTVSAPSGSQIQQTTVTVTWTSDHPATTWLEWGPPGGATGVYGNSTLKADTTPMARTHSATATSLLPGTTYHLRARSEDGWGNTAASVDFTVATLAAGTDAYLTAEAAVAGRVAHWRLGDTSKAAGAAMADGVGTFAGTYQGTPQDAAGIIATSTNHAVRLDGASWGQAASAAALSPEVGASAKMTLSAWWEEWAAPAGTEALAAKGTGAGNQWEYALQRTPTGVSANIWDLLGNVYVSAVTGVTITPNQRHRLTMVYDAAQATFAAKLSLYLDGTLVAGGASGPGTTPSAGTANFTIGERAAGDQRVGTATNTVLVQDVALRNVALTAAQELSIYSAATPAPVAAASSAGVSTATASVIERVVTGASALGVSAATAGAVIAVAQPTITGITVTAISQSTATIQWSTDLAADSQVDYGLSSAYDRSTPPDPAIVTLHSVTLTGLVPGTIYHFRVRSNPGAGGLTAVSADGTFQTVALAVLTISGLQASSVGPNQVALQWTTNLAADTQADYGPTSAYGSQTPLDPAPVLLHSATITGLSPNTAYHVRARAHDPSSATVLSGDLTVQTSALAGLIYTWIEANGTAHVLHSSADPAFLVMQGAKGYGVPPTQWLEDRVPQHDGPIVHDVLYDAREIEVPLLVRMPDYPSLMGKLRSLRQWTNVKKGDGTLQIAEPDGTIRQFTCRLKQGLEGQEGPDVSGPTFRRLVLVFRTSGSDPYARAPSPLSFTYLQAAASATWFPILPLVLGGAGIFAQPTISNPGDVEAEPVWTLIGPMTNPVLTNTTTGAKVSLTTALLAGQTLTIDTRFRQKAVIRNDGTKLFSALSNDSALWTLQPGQNVLSVVTSGTTTASQVQLSFTPRGL
jgi:hypothetical protein